MLTQFKNQLAKGLLLSTKAIIAFAIACSVFSFEKEIKTDSNNIVNEPISIDDPRKPRL
jgi:hypothetical protein